MSRTIDPRKLTNWYNFQARFYHLWRDRYDSPLIADVAVLLGPAAKPAAILDAGCGTGMFAIGLARACPDWKIEGLDAAERMLGLAQRQAARFGLENVGFRQGDVAALPHPDGSINGVVAAGLFPNLNDWGGPLREFHRVLGPGGKLVVVELDRTAMTGTMKAFFRLMILGYRLFSTLMPRFRFAERWNVKASTVDTEVLFEEARVAGFTAGAPTRRDSHLVLRFEKGAD